MLKSQNLSDDPLKRGCSKPWSKVLFYADKIIKKQDELSSQIEAEKSKQGYEIGIKTNLFRAPKVLNVHYDQGQIDFERINGLVTIREYVHDKHGLNELFDSVGRSLAFIHNELKLPDEMKKNMPKEYLYSLGSKGVFLHGDFNSINIQIVQETGELVILDWAMSHIFDHAATVGPLYFDLFYFIHTMFFGRYFSSEFKMIKNREEYLKKFLDGYFSISKHDYDADELQKAFSIYYMLMYKRHAKQKGYLRFLLYKPNFNSLKKFIETI